ncbi:hypothetical protein FACS1894132_00610 [Clostridia bacterium]|nr:hypothetical protein FACS1894132_00610 [Clostridia bacterium]
MKKTFKKVIALVMATALVATSAFSISSIGEDNWDEVYAEVVAYYEEDPQFLLMQEFSPDGAAQYLIDETQKRIDISQTSKRTRATTSTTAYVTFSNVQQSTTWYCGYASALMAIDGMGYKANVAGTTNAAKQTTLRNLNPWSDYGDGAFVSELVADLNYYIPSSGKQYGFYAAATMSINTFKSKVYTSLQYNRAPILHASTTNLPYYGDVTLDHYIAISSIDQQYSTVVLRDPHYNGAYFGNHTVNVPDALSTISSESGSNGRYLICY